MLLKKNELDKFNTCTWYTPTTGMSKLWKHPLCFSDEILVTLPINFFLQLILVLCYLYYTCTNIISFIIIPNIILIISYSGNFQLASQMLLWIYQNIGIVMHTFSFVAFRIYDIFCRQLDLSREEPTHSYCDISSS